MNSYLDEWVAQGDGDPGEPWNSFERARQLVHSGLRQEAVKIWRQIAVTEGLESRQVLQAWHFLREAGEQPPADRAKLVHGAVAEMPVRGGHDLLAAYRDGTARYLNYSGKAVVWEDRCVAPIQSAVNDWLAQAQVIVNAIGPWNQPALPPLPPGHARLMMLTPSGPHFGQGPVADLSADQVAGSFITAATGLMQLVVSRAMASHAQFSSPEYESASTRPLPHTAPSRSVAGVLRALTGVLLDCSRVSPA